MATTTLNRPGAQTSGSLPLNVRRPESRVYAIAFDMDIESSRQHYGDPYNNACLEIRRVLQAHGFTWQQGSVYFGGSEINAVTCVMAAMDLARTLPGSAPVFVTFRC